VLLTRAQFLLSLFGLGSAVALRGPVAVQPFKKVEEAKPEMPEAWKRQEEMLYEALWRFQNHIAHIAQVDPPTPEPKALLGPWQQIGVDLEWAEHAHAALAAAVLGNFICKQYEAGCTGLFFARMPPVQNGYYSGVCNCSWKDSAGYHFGPSLRLTSTQPSLKGTFRLSRFDVIFGWMMDNRPRRKSLAEQWRTGRMLRPRDFSVSWDALEEAFPER
jgi:hypothetical protein